MKTITAKTWTMLVLCVLVVLGSTARLNAQPQNAASQLIAIQYSDRLMDAEMELQLLLGSPRITRILEEKGFVVNPPVDLFNDTTPNHKKDDIPTALLGTKRLSRWDTGPDFAQLSVLLELKLTRKPDQSAEALLKPIVKELTAGLSEICEQRRVGIMRQANNMRMRLDRIQRECQTLQTDLASAVPIDALQKSSETLRARLLDLEITRVSMAARQKALAESIERGKTAVESQPQETDPMIEALEAQLQLKELEIKQLQAQVDAGVMGDALAPKRAQVEHLTIKAQLAERRQALAKEGPAARLDQFNEKLADTTAELAETDATIEGLRNLLKDTDEQLKSQRVLQSTRATGLLSLQDQAKELQKSWLKLDAILQASAEFKILTGDAAAADVDEKKD